MATITHRRYLLGEYAPEPETQRFMRDARPLPLANNPRFGLFGVSPA